MDKRIHEKSEWPHYFWQKFDESNDVKHHNFRFRTGYSHKDIS